MKKILRNAMLSMLRREAVRRYLQDVISEFGGLKFEAPHSFKCDKRTRDSPGAGNAPVFISARFRSGSTLFWNCFRGTRSVTAYYEPLNPRRWFDAGHRGGRVDSSHRKIDNYWNEYGLIGGSCRVPWEDHWSGRGLYLSPHVPALKLKSYIDLLIDSAEGRPVLQFNRVDLRLHWLRETFPDCFIVTLTRQPRDQWLSTFLTREPVGTEAVFRDFLAHDEFYLCEWVDDLRSIFPVLNEVGDWHPYQVSYLIWSLSKCLSHKFSDANVNYEELVANPGEILAHLSTLLQIPEIGSALDISTLDSRSVNRWRKYADESWFAERERVVDDLMPRILGQTR